jgi:lanthanide-dependent methanol dehydrogenase
VDTGMAKWAMQTTPHDEWDYDATNEVILFENKNKTYATQINKNGFIYTWQADNGSLIAAEKVHPFVNWATGVDLKTGVPRKSAYANTHQDYNAKGICPSLIGAKGLSAAASYSPKTNTLYIPQSHMCMTFEAPETKYKKGQPWYGATYSLFAGPSDALGIVSAYDLNSLKQIWYKKEKFSLQSGILSTKSEILSYGTLDGWFKVLETKEGKELWKFKLGAGSTGNAFTYAIKGKQYLGIFSGLGLKIGHIETSQHGCVVDPVAGFGGGPELCDMAKYHAIPSGGAINIFSL